MRAPALVLALLATAGCRPAAEPAPVPGGDPEEGRRLVRTLGCHSCHVVPGVRGADGRVGPPLTAFAGRVFIAGRLPNTPENLVRFLVDPPALAPGTAMPDVGATEEQARHLAAYLHTLH
jgi:cytochrome c